MTYGDHSLRKHRGFLMCCHSSPWVSSKMLRVWRSGNAADLVHELQIVSISWNLLQKSNVYNVWRSRRNTKGNVLSLCPVERTKSFLPVLAQMSQASKRYLAESEPKNKLACMGWNCFFDQNLSLAATSNLQLWSLLLLFDESTDFLIFFFFQN